MWVDIEVPSRLVNRYHSKKEEEKGAPRQECLNTGHIGVKKENILTR